MVLQAAGNGCPESCRVKQSLINRKERLEFNIIWILSDLSFNYSSENSSFKLKFIIIYSKRPNPILDLVKINLRLTLVMMKLEPQHPRPRVPINNFFHKFSCRNLILVKRKSNSILTQQLEIISDMWCFDVIETLGQQILKQASF